MRTFDYFCPTSTLQQSKTESLLKWKLLKTHTADEKRPFSMDREKRVKFHTDQEGLESDFLVYTPWENAMDALAI